jgi:hypothetical protein
LFLFKEISDHVTYCDHIRLLLLLDGGVFLVFRSVFPGASLVKANVFFQR